MSSGKPGPFLRQQMVLERPPPVKTTGFSGILRARLFGSVTNTLITIICALLIWVCLIPAIRFLLVDAVWTGGDRQACLAENVGRMMGACWPFIQSKIGQLVYGFYPEPYRWRANLTFILAAALLLPLLMPKLPAKGLNATLFFLAFPFVAYFLLHGGGLDGFAVTWSTAWLTGLNDSIGGVGQRLATAGEVTALVGPVLFLAGKLILLISVAISYLLRPLVWLRDLIQTSGIPAWTDLVLTAVLVSAVMFVLGGRSHARRFLIVSLVTFAGIGLVIAIMGLDRGGLPAVDTRLWGGLLLTLVVSVTGIVVSMPVGIVLALGRRSALPLIRIFSVAFIEIWRGVPLITVLFLASYMLPLFVPTGFTMDGLMRVLIGISLFAGAYQAEVIRGGLQAIPRGQAEAAHALGLSWWKTNALVVLPQALRHVIPGIVNSFIGMFKDTSLVSIVALFDLLGSLRASFSDPLWATPSTVFTGFAFTGLIYFAFCFGMSRYSLLTEQRLNAHRRT